MTRRAPLRRPAAAVVLTALLLAVACRTEPETRPMVVTPDATAEAAVPEGRVRIGDVVWYRDYDAALAHARSVDLPLWVHFGEHPG